MKKNIIIIGAPRSGKNTLAYKLNKRLNYNVICGDQLMNTFKKTFPDMEDESPSIPFTSFIINYLNELSNGACCRNSVKFAAIITYVDLKRLMSELLNKDDYIFIGLTLNDISSEQMLANIRKYDEETDWTYKLTDERLMGCINSFIKDGNEYFYHKIFIPHNFCIYETSSDRERVLEQIVSDVENKHDTAVCCL